VAVAYSSFEASGVSSNSKLERELQSRRAEVGA
jgi:hypothetical protein